MRGAVISRLLTILRFNGRRLILSIARIDKVLIAVCWCGWWVVACRGTCTTGTLAVR
jgi:hypothetical protein